MQLSEKFVSYTQPLLQEEWVDFEQALEQESPTSIRINPKKANGLLIEADKVPWCETGYYLAKRPSFTFDPLFHAGAYYVQEASSMFIEQVFKQYLKKDIKVLDLCAAPGGKSSHIARLISEDSLLISNEVIKSRAFILSENMTKSGYPNVIVTNNDPSDIGNKLPCFFDVILIDAPCSGEGMFRKDPHAVEEWSPANVQLCKERQQRIVVDVWDALKPEGILIYSTCTYNKLENEENINWILDNFDAEILPIETDANWNISQAYNNEVLAHHFFPHKVKGEGFFLAVIQKKGNVTFDNLPSNKRNKKQNTAKPQTLALEYKKYICRHEEYTFFDKNGLWFAFPEQQYEAFLEVSSQLKLVSAGIYMGEFKGKDFLPQHSLAMSNLINKDAFTLHDIDRETAIAYLRKEALVFEDQPKGYILLTYKNVPLGFIKNIGNRANNLYPNEWRIRTSHLPDETTDVLI